MLRLLTAGESHGRGEIAVLDGVPAGLALKEELINFDLKRRMHGYGRGGRMDIETDTVEVISGCRRGLTIGSPVGLMITNLDYKINELPDVKCPRPGHADLAGVQKYDFDDARDVLERASARETTARVAAGAVAKMVLSEFGMDIISHVTMLGGIKADTEGLSFDDIKSRVGIEKSRLRCADEKAEQDMCDLIDKAQDSGNTLGGSIEIIVKGAPAGLGSYTQWDRKLDGILAQAVVSIPAVKAVSIGKGMEASALHGSSVHDPIKYDASSGTYSRTSNNAGGLEGGVTNGSDVIINAYMKPISTLSSPLNTVDIDTKKVAEAATERSDVTAVPACGVVAEAMVAIKIASAFMEKFGSDSIKEMKANYDQYMRRLRDM